MANLSKFTPARLVVGTRWYIVFYQTCTETSMLKRHRETHNLNFIKSLRERKKRANELMNKINTELPFGYPYNQKIETQSLTLTLTNIKSALQHALDLKIAELNRKSSAKGYKSKFNFFCEFLKEKKLEKMNIGEWKLYHAQCLINELALKKRPSPVTYNDYLRQLKCLFDILQAQGYVKENHFEGLKKRKEVPTKIRNRLTIETRKTFIEEVKKENDKWFLLTIVLQYYFFLRPVEISRMTVGNIDLDKQTVSLAATEHKTYKERFLKIPDVAKKYFPSELSDYPNNYYLIGSGIQPSAVSIDKNGMYRRNQSYLKKLEKKGFDISGLSLYSWKNTGGFDMLNENNEIQMTDVQERMGHTDIRTTRRYVSANDKNVEYIRNELM